MTLAVSCFSSHFPNKQIKPTFISKRWCKSESISVCWAASHLWIGRVRDVESIILFIFKVFSLYLQINQSAKQYFFFLGSRIKTILINYRETSVIQIYVVQNNMIYTDILRHIFIWLLNLHRFDGFILHLLYCIFNALRLCWYNGDPPLIPHLSHMHEVCFVVTFMKLPAVAETLKSCYLEWMIIPVVEVFSQKRLGSKALLPFLHHTRKGNPYLSLWWYPDSQYLEIVLAVRKRHFWRMKTIYSLHEILFKNPNIPAAFWIERVNK